MAFEGVKERPILGWGQSNYNYVFNKYYRPELLEGEAWFDRVHNIVMDWLIAGGIIGAYKFAGLYGVAIAAAGMMATTAMQLAIDAFGPIADNAGGIAEMSGLKEARERTDILDAAGNTTAAIGKGFAIGSATLVALALFGAFVTRSKMLSVDILKPMEFSCLVIGAMLPYAFSAMTMSAVGDAAEEMIKEITE